MHWYCYFSFVPYCFMVYWPALPKERCLSVLCLCLSLEQKFAGINRITEAVAHTVYTVFHNYGNPGCQWNNLVNVQFIYTKICRPEQEIMLFEVLSEFL